ncbi:hypothetical protein H7142_00630 [Candidatus Saccharibacteria bacterium]|nr:hypothetical protein [Candidatus Saccharibacteria bacterium]
MSHNQNFEVPTQRFGEVVPRDLYTPEQLRNFEIIDAFGKSTVAQAVELEDDSAPQTVEAATGQYL